MDSMWLEVILNTKAEDLDDLCAKLIANGVPGLAVEEEEEFRAFLEENRQYWDYVDEALLDQMKGVSRVKLYVTDDADGQAQLKTYLAGIDLPYTTIPLREYDWAHSWQKYYRPLAIGKRLYIVPEWERDTAAIPDGATRPHLRHRVPCLHPAVPGGGGGPRAARGPGAGPGLRQRHFGHRRPAPGGQPRHRGGH